MQHQHQHMPTSEIKMAIKMVLVLAEMRGRGSEQDRARLWWCAEALLHDETYDFQPRPPAIADDRGVFREDAVVRRQRGVGVDKWHNSGGRKGSTVWPRGDDEVARLRCQYGTVKREGRPSYDFKSSPRYLGPKIEDLGI